MVTVGRMSDGDVVSGTGGRRAWKRANARERVAKRRAREVACNAPRGLSCVWLGIEDYG